MNNYYKILAVLMCFAVVFSVSACSDYDNKESAKQVTYNTLFKQPSTPAPYTKATEETQEDTTAEETTQAKVEQATVPQRTGERIFYEQVSQMRNISSDQLLQEINIGISVANSFDFYGLGSGKTVDEYETANGNPKVTEALIEAYKKAGFKAVRIPVSWTDHIEDDGKINSEWLDEIRKVVGYVIDRNMYCIINSDNDQSWLTTADKSFETTKQKFANLWHNIAANFSDFNDHLLFESVGEVLKKADDYSEPDKTDIANANKLNEVFVKTVRKTGGNNEKRHLIVTTYGSFIDEATLSGFKVPKDTAKNRIIAKVNTFVPSSFCLDESGKTLWGTNDDKKYLTTILLSIYSRFKELGIPVIIGEFGIINKGNESSKIAYSKCFLNTTYNCYINCFWYDDGNDFCLVNRTDYSQKHKNLIKTLIKSAK